MMLLIFATIDHHIIFHADHPDIDAITMLIICC